MNNPTYGKSVIQTMFDEYAKVPLYQYQGVLHMIVHCDDIDLTVCDKCEQNYPEHYVMNMERGEIELWCTSCCEKYLKKKLKEVVTFT
jgi:hypothetical protein